MTPDEEMDEWLAQEREGAGAHDPCCPFDPEGWEDCACEVIAKVRADERDKFMEEARSDIAAAVLINEAKADERERIAVALEVYDFIDGDKAARIARNGGMSE